MTIKQQVKLSKLLKARQECADYGNIPALQYVNELIAKLAKQLKVDYYSL